MKLNHTIALDGLFEIVRIRKPSTASATSRLILISRGGRLFGADPKGGVYVGRLVAAHKRHIRVSALKGTYEIPLRRAPRCRSLTHRSSIRFSIAGEIDLHARSQSATVSVGRKMIDIEITYLGPLPP